MDAAHNLMQNPNGSSNHRDIVNHTLAGISIGSGAAAFITSALPWLQAFAAITSIAVGVIVIYRFLHEKK